MRDNFKQMILTILAIVLLMPLVSVLLYIFYKWLFEYFNISNYLPNDIGGFGDIFGLSTSVFSGLAFVGLIYVLSKDLKNRDEQEKPIPSIIFEEGGIEVFKKSKSTYNDCLHLKVKSKIKSYSNSIAISARVKFVILFGGREINSEWYSLPEPVGDELIEVEDFIFEFNNDGSTIKDRFKLVNSLMNNSAWMIAYINYENINGIKYSSFLKYQIKPLDIYFEKLTAISLDEHLNMDDFLNQGQNISLLPFSKEYKHSLDLFE